MVSRTTPLIHCSISAVKTLTEDELQRIKVQDARLVPEFKANVLEKDAAKFWDLFYKRNESRFFKDRHWTTREFVELLDENSKESRTLLEIGCGVGNFIYPLVLAGLNFHIKACDFSTRAITLLKTNPLYNAEKIHAFQTDITKDCIYKHVQESTVDIVTLIFVLSAIHPNNFAVVLNNIYKLLKPGGFLLFRDYGLYDMAQLRFKAGHKIGDNFYMRQDGTRSYYFSTEEMAKLFTNAGFEIITNSFVHRRTVNKKENVDVPRIFIQSKLRKSPASNT